ncbi:hypothetical protein ABEF95_013154 [Exophiala dermatitidis]
MLLLSVFYALLASGSGLSATYEEEQSYSQNGDIDHYIFNAINSAGRTCGSSVNPNGMSFFLAKVPKGTLLYHGNPHPYPVNDTEFLAFDPEFSLVFAGKRPGEGRGPPHRGLPGQNQDWLQAEAPESDQDIALPAEDLRAGWLHTYAANKDLNIVYIDGKSGTKSQSGTLDSQDRILFNDSVSGGFGGEYQRAAIFCNASSTRWDNRIDGVIRLNGDWELILCSFKQDLDLVRITRVLGNSPFHPPRNLESEMHHQSSHSQKLTISRPHGIGIDILEINFDHIVSAYDYGLDLFNWTDHESSSRYSPERNRQTLKPPIVPRDSCKGRLPRLRHIPSTALEPIRSDIEKLILEHDPNDGRHNWRTITDQTVTRYAGALSSMSDGASTLEALQHQAQALLEPFIDYDGRDAQLEVERCATEYIPYHARNDSLPYRAVYGTTKRICATLQGSMAENSTMSIVQRIQTLIGYLDWTVWKESSCCRRP